MESENTTKNARQMDRRALIIYTSCAAFVYTLALGYCYLTGHIFEAGLVGVVMGVLGILVVNVYKSK